MQTTSQLIIHLTHQTVQLRHRALVSWVTNVPDFNTALSSRVYMSGGVTDSNGTHHLSMVQRVDLTGMARDPWAHQSIWREWNWLHLSVGCDMKGVGTDDRGEKMKEIFLLVILILLLIILLLFLQIYLRFATRDSCQTRRHSRNSHVRMRIKTHLWDGKQTFYELSTNT